MWLLAEITDAMGRSFFLGAALLSVTYGSLCALDAPVATRVEGTRLHAAAAPILLGANSQAGFHLREALQLGRERAPFYSNRSLFRPDPNVTRAIIVIHGSSRNATEYFETIMAT